MSGAPRVPVFNDLERVSRLTRFALPAHRDILRTTRGHEAIELCVRALEGC